MESNREADAAHPRHTRRLRRKITTVSWWDLAHTLAPILLASAAAIWLVLRVVQPAAPARHETQAAGT